MSSAIRRHFGLIHLILFCLAVVVGGLSYWKYYQGTPEYKAKQAFEAAEQSMQQGLIGDAAEYYFTAWEIPSDLRREAWTRLGHIAQIETLAAATPGQAAKAVVTIIDNNPKLSEGMYDKGMQLVVNHQETDPASSYRILEKILTLLTTEHDATSLQESLLSAWMEREPAAAEPAIKLALLYEQLGKTAQEIQPLLSKHQNDLGDDEAARLYGQILAYQGNYLDAYRHLNAYTDKRLKAFQQAETDYTQSLDDTWQATIDFLNAGKAPQSFYEKYERADEAGQQEMLQEFYAQQRDRSHVVKRALENYRQSAYIVPVAMDLGMVMLSLAQETEDAVKRKQRLEKAETTFVAVQAAAGDSDEYLIQLGQVYYWLGKEAHGEELFEQYLSNNQRQINALYHVSSIYRDLGAREPALKLAMEAYNKTSAREERFYLASFLALLSNTLEEKAGWLEKADLSNTRVRADYEHIKGQLAQADNKNANAETHYRNALKLYKKQPDNPSKFNNIALIYFSLFRVSGNPEHQNSGLKYMDQAVELASNSSIVLSNAADRHLEAAMRAVLGETIDFTGLGMDASITQLAYLYQNDSGREKIGAALTAEDSYQKAVHYLRRALTLAPKDQSHYSSLRRLYWFTNDSDGISWLANKTKDASVDLSASETERLRFVKGNDDDHFVERYRARNSYLNDMLGETDQKRWPKQRGFLEDLQISNALGLVFFTQNFDVDKLLEQARKNYGKSKCKSTLDTYNMALINSAYFQAKNGTEFFNHLSDSYIRHLGPYRVVATELESNPRFREYMSNNAYMKEYVSLMREMQPSYKNQLSVADWAILRHIAPELGQKFKQAIAADSNKPLLFDIDLSLDPMSSGEVLSQYWLQLILDNPQKAESVLASARDRGVVLPERVQSPASPTTGEA